MIQGPADAASAATLRRQARPEAGSPQESPRSPVLYAVIVFVLACLIG